MCLQAVRKEFKLRIGATNERTHSISEAGISRKNRTAFEMKLVMTGVAKNSDFSWVDRPVC